MKLPPNTRVKRFPWTILPVLSKFTGTAIYPNIYLPIHVYSDLKSKNPKPKHVSVLIHEQTHIHRQRKMGLLPWGLKYIFSPRFRFEEELAAINKAMRYFKKKKLEWDTKRSAKFLSSYLYLWCVKYEVAKRKLDEAWARA